MLDTLPSHAARAIHHETFAQELKDVIAVVLGRQAGEEIRCVPVYGNYYRCNWWVGTGTVGAQIRRSSFLKIVDTPDGPAIEDVTAP